MLLACIVLRDWIIEIVGKTLGKNSKFKARTRKQKSTLTSERRHSTVFNEFLSAKHFKSL